MNERWQKAVIVVVTRVEEARARANIQNERMSEWLSARQNNAKRTVIAVAVVELREVQNSIANIIIRRQNKREGEVRTWRAGAHYVNFKRRKNILT